MEVNEVTETLSSKEQMAWDRNFKAAHVIPKGKADFKESARRES